MKLFINFFNSSMWSLFRKSLDLINDNMYWLHTSYRQRLQVEIESIIITFAHLNNYKVTL